MQDDLIPLTFPNKSDDAIKIVDAQLRKTEYSWVLKDVMIDVDTVFKVIRITPK